MLEPLTDPFATEIARRALVELIVVGLACGPLAVWICLYRRSYAAESIAHAALPGLVIASLAGLPLVLGAAGGLAAAALAIALAGRVRGIGADVSVAIVVTALIGLGALLALSDDAPARLGSLLFGDPLAVSGDDIAISAGLTAVVAAALAALHRPLALACFDPVAAGSLGVSNSAMAALLLVILALTTLVAVEALGNLLVVALLIAPGATALRLTSRLGHAIAIAIGVAIVAGVGGLYVSHYLELAAGASIALVAVLLFGLSLPFGSRTGGRAASGGSAVEAVGAAA
jgi:ABC-type Mn2+/Zn2+ transport system permease subunit